MALAISEGLTTLEQMTVTVLHHPLGAGQVAFPGPSRALRFLLGVDVQDNTRDFGPICAFGVCVEKAQIGNKVLLIVDRSGLRCSDTKR